MKRDPSIRSHCEDSRIDPTALEVVGCERKFGDVGVAEANIGAKKSISSTLMN